MAHAPGPIPPHDASAARDRRYRRKLRIAHLAVSLLAAALLLVVLTRPLGTSSSQPAAFEPGEERLQQEAAKTGLPTGQPAPGLGTSTSLGLVDPDGGPFSLAQFRGGPVWIVFWATYCEACRLEEADLIAAYRAHAAEGLTVVGIDVGEPAEDVRNYARSHGLPYPIAIEQNGDARRAYGAIGTPTHFFVSADGVIRNRAFGRLTREEMDEHLASILAAARPAADPTRE